MFSWQKFWFGLIVLILVGYFVYVYARDGDFSSFGFDKTPSPTAVTVASTPTPTPASAPKLTPVPTVRPSGTPVPATVLSSMNSHRAQAGVGALSTNITLQNLAQTHAADMASNGYFSHTNSAGVTFQQRIAASGYSGTAFAENIGYTGSSAVSIVADWMASADHKANMLGGQYTTVGVGIAQGTFQGRQTVFVVAVFGNR